MKKILCIVLSIIMILPTAASAAVSGEVEYSESTKNIYIAGDLSKTESKAGSVVTLFIFDKNTDEIKYIEALEVDENFKYETKFDFGGSLSDCIVRIKEGTNDVTSSVEVAYATNPVVYNLTFRDENESHVIEADEIVKATAEVVNKTGNDGKFKVIAAFYDENNKMIGCDEILDDTFTFEDVTKKVSGFSEITIPEGTVQIKGFMWNDTETMIPLTEELNRQPGDKIFGNTSETITYAAVGGSLEHAANNRKLLEHYYKTRYPERDIVFVNKGITGNGFGTIIERFDYDITEDDLTGEVDVVTISTSLNALGPGDFIDGVDYDNVPADAPAEVKASKEKVDNNIAKFVEDYKKVIGMFKEKGISVTIVTSFILDHAIVEPGSGFDYPTSVNDYGLRRMKEEAIKLGEEYNIPVIDIYTGTNEITKEVREKYATPDTLVISGKDGVHPEDQGGFYMSYLFITQQGGTPIVAEVEIDALTGENVTNRAQINVTDFSANRVEYEYLAHSIPLAYTDVYKTWENWGVDVTGDLNNEIIKISNLDAGNYSIVIDGNKLTKTYTAQELAEGVNIAVDENNPAQIQSKIAYEATVKKVKNEATYRSIATTDQAIRRHPEVDISKFNESTPAEEFKVLGTYTSNYKQYFSLNSENYASKKYEVENWAKIQAQEKEAKELSKPIKRTVVIEKQ